MYIFSDKETRKALKPDFFILEGSIICINKFDNSINAVELLKEEFNNVDIVIERHVNTLTSCYKEKFNDSEKIVLSDVDRMKEFIEFKPIRDCKNEWEILFDVIKKGLEIFPKDRS